MSVTEAWGLKYTEVLSLAWLAYKEHGTKGKWRFSDGSIWNLTEIFAFGSFRAVLVKGRKTILSFSGTDDAIDWADNIQQGAQGISVQYAYALFIARSNASDVVVGHSLGGGLASYVAIYGGRQAATVNPAPLNINLVSLPAMIKNYSLVINYVALGEALDILDFAAPNMSRVGRTFYVASKGGKNPISRHEIQNMQDFQQPVKA